MIGCFKDPTYVLMRVLLCKIQCPSFICFCKPSPHIYAAGSLKLEDTPQVSSSTSLVDAHDHDDNEDDAHVVVVEEEEEEDVDHVDGLLNEVGERDCAVEEKKEEEKEEEGHSNGEILKSSLKREVLDSEDDGRKEKKKVQWVDLMGKELAEIREFESSEEEDSRYDGDQNCVCVIL
ncbi:hypothetical protein V5N11_017499 [Cardamine amara subsp. amara]|uniref:Uncharacterized protein n=1 Tax=Cardamine amara subsp. amara TaxID=228776 RepID=A0ABD1AE10_CARAN